MDTNSQLINHWKSLNEAKDAAHEQELVAFLRDNSTCEGFVGKLFTRVNSLQQARKWWNGHTWEMVVAQFLQLHRIDFVEQFEFEKHKIDFVLGTKTEMGLQNSIVLSTKTTLRERKGQDKYLDNKCLRVFQLCCDKNMPALKAPQGFNVIINVFDPLYNWNWFINHLHEAYPHYFNECNI